MLTVVLGALVLFCVRTAGLLVLIEFTVLGLVFLYAFGVRKIEASSAPGYVEDSSAPTTFGFGKFLCDVLKLHSIFGGLALVADSQAPLNDYGKGENVA